MDYEQRIHEIEKDLISVHDRLGKVEDKASGAWKTIGEINGRMDKMEKRMESLEVDVKSVKSEQMGITKKLKVLIAMVAVIGVISVGFFIYIWRHDAELAKGILTLGASVSKAVGI